jgi:type IV pilus assembly protein PilW
MSYFTGPFPAKVLQTPLARGRQRGLSLVELMISITLGMVAVAGAISIYLSNRNSYQLVESAARVQENARFAVEFLGRDLREAGGIVCGGNLVQENVLESTEKAKWWGDWFTGLNGYESDTNAELPTSKLAQFGTAKQGRKSGTDAVIIWSASTASSSVLTQASSGTQFTVYPAQTASNGTVFTACDDARVSTFTLGQDATTTVTAAQTPTTAIKQGGFVNQLNASAWYICVGLNTSSPYSLCRESLDAGADSNAQEILENVTNMQITYLQGDGNGTPTGTNYVAASAITNWANVLAVRVVLTLATPDKVGLSTSGASQALTQAFPFTVAIRRRLK